jgi:hypothetical protein
MFGEDQRMTDEREVLDRRTKKGRKVWEAALAGHENDREAAQAYWDSKYVSPKVAGHKAGKAAPKAPQAPTLGESAEEARQKLKAELMAEIRGEIASEIREELKSELAKPAEPLESREDQLRTPALNVDPDPSADGVTVNFVEDGLTLLGKVWVRGEIATVRRGSKEWEDLTDREGNMVLEMEEDEQIKRWGQRMFRPGVGNWKFDFDDPNLDDAEKERLRTIQLERDAMSAGFK